MSMLHDEIGNRIYTARRTRGRTQAQLANAVGCSNMHISNIENGKASANFCQIALAAEYLSTDWRSVVTGIATGELELAKALSSGTQDQGTTADIKEITEVVRRVLGKPLQQRQKVIAAWKAVLELA